LIQTKIYANICKYYVYIHIYNAEQNNIIDKIKNLTGLIENLNNLVDFRFTLP